jgi:hypothetical protein
MPREGDKNLSLTQFSDFLDQDRIIMEAFHNLSMPGIQRARSGQHDRPQKGSMAIRVYWKPKVLKNLSIYLKTVNRSIDAHSRADRNDE